MIFPGMDPYLENPALWMGVHNRLSVYIADYLQPRLEPRYLAGIEERVYLERRDREFRPDVIVKQPRLAPSSDRTAATIDQEADVAVEIWSPIEEIHEPYLTILDLRNGQKLIAVIEVVSPTNKNPGPGRESYLAKQQEVLGSEAHLIEIDLLRAGRHALAVPEYRARQSVYDYLVSVNCAEGSRSRFQNYPRTVRQRLPRIAIPLADDDPPVVLDLQTVLAQAYVVGRYVRSIDYSKPCIPPLSADDQTWADGLIRGAFDSSSTLDLPGPADSPPGS